MSYEKSIELYGDGIGRVDYVESMGSDLTIVNSARVSFGTQKEELDGRDKKLINYLAKHKHTSTFEHNVVTFRFTVPLYVRSQHHRHRTWSYNEISRRYTDVNINFYEPEAFRTQHKSNRQASNPEETGNPMLVFPPKLTGMEVKYPADLAVKNHHRKSLRLYNMMMDAGVCREQARGVLPQNLYTEYYGTVNMSNLLKFIDLRSHEGAQWEIQRVAEACLEIAGDLWPIATKAYRDGKDLKPPALEEENKLLKAEMQRLRRSIC
jgi:thymidylate synthase (FAD)